MSDERLSTRKRVFERAAKMGIRVTHEQDGRGGHDGEIHAPDGMMFNAYDLHSWPLQHFYSCAAAFWGSAMDELDTVEESDGLSPCDIEICMDCREIGQSSP